MLRITLYRCRIRNLWLYLSLVFWSCIISASYNCLPYSWVKASTTLSGRWVHASWTGEACLTMFSQPPYFCTHNCKYVLNTKYYQNTFLTMRISTTKCNARLTKAINKFHTYNSTVSVLKITNKHKVNYSTLTNRINSKHGFIILNGSLNRLLVVA
jgi:hypothetical protein